MPSSRRTLLQRAEDIFKLINDEFIKFAHDNGLKVNVWTVNEENIMKKLINLGVDGIITDDISLLKKVLRKPF